MSRLSSFDSLLTFGILAPLLIRLGVSFFLLNLGWERSRKPYKLTAVLYIIFAVLLFIGMRTQITAILSVLLLKFDFYVDYWKNRKTIPVEKTIYFLYAMAILILLSLLFTGPGAFAFDLPL